MLMFFNFLTDEIIPRGWKPYRTEWSIFDEDHMVAGQIDSVWIDSSTGSLHMIDWKRCAKPLNPGDGERFNRFGRTPCDFLLDNSFSHYAVQQNLYAAILRDSYGVKLSSMWLVQLHIDLPSYSFIPVPAFLDVAAVLLQRSAPVRGSHPLDRLGGAPAPADDAIWQQRLSKRSASVAAIKKSEAYLRCRALERTHPVTNRMMSPDPYDTTISKRNWEWGIINWRNGLRAQANLFSRTENCCLLKSLWSLGVPVPVCRDGPFFALLDGNVLLAEFNLVLEWIAAEEIADGRYVRWHDGHFVAVEVFDTHIDVHDEGVCTSFCHLEGVVLDSTTTFFHLVQAPGTEMFEIMFGSNYDRLGGVGEADDDERTLEELLQEGAEVLAVVEQDGNFADYMDESVCELQMVPLKTGVAHCMDESVGIGSMDHLEAGPEDAEVADQNSSIRRADIKGSKTSDVDFEKLFESCDAGADSTLSGAAADVGGCRSNIKDRTRELSEMVANRHRAMLRG